MRFWPWRLRTHFMQHSKFHLVQCSLYTTFVILVKALDRMAASLGNGTDNSLAQHQCIMSRGALGVKPPLSLM